MDKVVVKKEKDDLSFINGQNDLSNNSTSRIVSLKSTKATKSNLKGKIKVKTLKEIKQEKSKKGKNPQLTNGHQVIHANVKKEVSLMSLSVPVNLMSLPNGVSGRRAFRVSTLHNNFSNVKVKQEPIESPRSISLTINNKSPTKTTSTSSSTATFTHKPTGVKKEEEEEEELDYEEELSDEIEPDYSSQDEQPTNGFGISPDLASEGSSFDNASNIVDFSDVPLCAKRDEDSMSLFAEDNFEEESEPVDQNRLSVLARKSNNSQEEDLRVTLEQNRAKSQSLNPINERNSHLTKSKKWDKYQKGNKNHFNIDRETMQKEDEIQRTNILVNVLKNYSIKSGVIKKVSNSQKPIPSLMSPEMINSYSNSMPKQNETLAVVHGSRRIFERQQSYPSTSNINGHSHDSTSQHWCTKGPYKNKDKKTQGVRRSVSQNEARSFRKRRSTEDQSTSGSDSDSKKTRITENHHVRKTKQFYCNTQKQLGKCNFSFCQFKHLNARQLEVYKLTKELPEDVEEENHDTQPENASQDNDNDDEQMHLGLIAAAVQAIDSLQISEGLQIVVYHHEKFPDKNHAIIPLVEKILLKCGDPNVDPSIATKVASQAFAMIPNVRGDYNRHDFTTLIQCLCRTGNSSRAYDIFDEMKLLKLSPTHEVYLDLINASYQCPLRAFDLLHEIKSFGLFRSSICSDLILLGCKARVPLLGRTWNLFKEMNNESIKPTREAFLALLDLLADKYESGKVFQALALYGDKTIIPSESCLKMLVRHCEGNPELVSQCIEVVSEIPKPHLDSETWNILLSNCYSETFNISTKALQVQSMMKHHNIKFNPQGYNGLLSSLGEAKQTMRLLTVIKDMANDNINLLDCKCGITAAVNSLMNMKLYDELSNVICLLADHGILVEEKPMLTVIEAFDSSQSYGKIQKIFKKCEQADLKMTITCFRKIYMSLEKWVQNPGASLDAYTAMKLAYPIIPDTSPKTQSTYKRNPSEVQRVKHRTRLCKYFLANKCEFGDACRFSHDVNKLAGQNKDIPKTSSNPFVLRSAIIPNGQVLSAPNAQRLPAPPLPPPIPPPFALSLNPMMHIGSYPPVSNPSAVWNPNIPFYQPSSTDTVVKDVTPPVPSPDHPIKEEPIPSPDEPDTSKMEVYLYEGKIEQAGKEQNYEELARIYVEMKNDKIQVSDEMLKMFYTAFTTFSNIGDALSSFVAIIDIQLDNPDSDDMETKESLDSLNTEFIGKLCVALMQFCRIHERLDEGYVILYVLHQYSINYSQCQVAASFVPNEEPLSSPSIALLAADMCLCLRKDPQYDGVLEVLRGCNYALPVDGSLLSAEEVNKRRQTFQQIINHYLSVKQYDIVEEFLKNVGDTDTFGMTSLKTIYNKLLKGYIDDEKVEDALRVIHEMESELVSREPRVLRSFVTCLGKIGRFIQAKDIFKSSCLQGAYPPFRCGNELWQCILWASFSKYEIQFYLERHLQLLNKYVEEQRASSQMPYDEKHLKKLRISIRNEDPMSLADLGLANRIQEGVIEVLANEFNPPLSCGVSDIIGEVLVNPRSLKRWFIANPTPDDQISTNSDRDEMHQRNVSALEGNMTIRVTTSQQPPWRKELQTKVRHTICGQLTKYLREGKLKDKDEFKRYARTILEDYLKQNTEVVTDYNRTERGKVIKFLEKYFDRR